MAVRYYSPENPGSYVTPSRLKRLGRQKQIEYMIHWFHALFDDPANETPYISREGGYQYIWGGPYDAADELGNEFGGIVPDEVIEAAVEELQSDGTYDWAPSSAHPARRAADEEAMADDFDEPSPPSVAEIQRRLSDGVVPSFGDPLELQERDVLRHQLAELRDLLTRSPPQHGGIGHNRPPEPLSLTSEQQTEALQAVDQMNAELIKATPNLAKIVESASWLEKARGWILKKIDKSVDNFVGAIGAAGGVAVVAGLADFPVLEKIEKVIRASLEWLNNVTLPF